MWRVHPYKPTIPFTPRKHLSEELDALGIPEDYRDRCVDYYAEYAKCVHVQKAMRNPVMWKRGLMENCHYYLSHWWCCKQEAAYELGLTRNTHIQPHISFFKLLTLSLIHI
eukprot:TRINITY_DN13456_c0_g1_i5.p3 TRINITY_DN13456_c0_g1~~TRINITY_DN13456_c0_g1_i5.p3  ORF type:complete len:111 (-),score=3.24 TRINITY_DN13456_c0_g1_i5:186-518(-)